MIRIVHCETASGFSAFPLPSPLSLSPFSSLLHHEIFDRFFRSERFGLRFENAADFPLIGELVGLGARAVHGGALAAVEHAELDAGRVDGQSHGAAEGVDFADDLPFAHAADGRIAAHQGDRVKIAGQEGGLGAHARRGQCRLDPGMSAADHQYVEIVNHRQILIGMKNRCQWWVITGSPSPGQGVPSNVTAKNRLNIHCPAQFFVPQPFCRQTLPLRIVPRIAG